MQRRSFLQLGSALAAPWPGRSAAPSRQHIIELHQPIPVPDDGLLLGNGDLSVSLYQQPNRIVWRFGKGDVWDRRLDLSEDPRPARIDEIAHGIRVEGWKCSPYAGGAAPTALHGTGNLQRLREICQGTPPSEDRRPYPCPKPVGELALHLPPDLQGFRIRQQLLIEECLLRVTCSWTGGATLEVEAFIPPSPNALALRWRVLHWTGQGAPIWFSLYRWADPPVSEFVARMQAEFRRGLTGSGRMSEPNPKVTPLEPPSVEREPGLAWIEQRFAPDPLFPDGFRCLVAPFASGEVRSAGAARLEILPGGQQTEGHLIVAVATSSDLGGPLAALRQVAARLAGQPAAAMAAWRSQTQAAARRFWSSSQVRIDDPLCERLWYETLHARRCTYRPGTVPPGLYLPSTVKDYSLWHGDYHLNYNFQQPFWGDAAANHPELGDAYFDGVAYFLSTGRKIAHDYYNCRGVFLQLSGYPVSAPDDWLGVAPMGRMAYMTGWASNQYWWRYLYTLDRDWLRSTGYPVLRDCALFYTDFMQKGGDGLYHVFPSNQGEDGFTGDPKDYTDRSQVMAHLRYCIRSAILASEVLAVDEDLRAQWRERLAHCAGDEGRPPLRLAGIEKERYEANPPEFERRWGDPPKAGQPWPSRTDPVYDWYCGHYITQLMQRLRRREFRPEIDFARFREIVERWRQPNGLLRAMSVARYGYAGAWTETLGVIAPLQEMLLQSWDGAIRLYPAWPRHVSARFERLRAEGAFLVSASWAAGVVSALEIFSEKGGRCRLYSPWTSGIRVEDDSRDVAVQAQAYGRLAFSTTAGRTYRVRPAAAS